MKISDQSYFWTAQVESDSKYIRLDRLSLIVLDFIVVEIAKYGSTVILVALARHAQLYAALESRQ